MTLATLLAETASRVPRAAALSFEGACITYAELDAMADAAVPASRVVPLPMPNEPESVARYHGALRRGAVVVPLNPLLAPAEVEARERPFDPAPGTAVVLFTSGTTGEPKRIELSHAQLRANAEYLAEALAVTGDDVLWGSAPLSHVFGMTGCMNVAIAAGAKLALARRFDPSAALEAIERESVTVFMGVPAMLAALVTAAREAGRAPQLRIAHCGGAPLPLDTLRAFEETFGAPVLEGYGMTEVGGVVALSHAGAPRKPGSVGTAAAGQELRIADDGEVMVGVDGRWLATGDIGKLDEDGYLFLLDRKKDVILRGGYSVYPRQVEEALHQHPSVREAVVVGVPHERLGEEVAALVVAEPGCSADALRAFARERVAAYAYPRLVVLVDALPRNASGKILRREIDRDALAELLPSSPSAPKVAEGALALSWSGGKDSALTLWTLRRAGREPAALLTTVTEGYDRISMHGVRRTLLARQAESVGVPLVEVTIPPSCSNEVYEQRFEQAFAEPVLRDIESFAFGDLFLEDIRAYREARLAAVARHAVFPIWGVDTNQLAHEFIDAGFEATLVCVDPRKLDRSFAGRPFDRQLLADLPSGVDPCGENGEFHTFVHAGPIFSRPIAFARGEIVKRDGFIFCDLIPGESTRSKSA